MTQVDDKQNLLNTITQDTAKAASPKMAQVSKPVPMEDQALLEWSNLNYFVPMKKPVETVDKTMVSAEDTQAFLDTDAKFDTLEAENVSKGLPPPNFVTKNKGKSCK